MRFHAAGRSTNAPTSTLPAVSLISATTKSGYIREVGVFNTTVTAAAVSLRKFSSAGTAGATITGGSYYTLEDGTVVAPALTLKDSFTSTAPTLVAGAIKQAPLGAAIGSGVIWTFGDTGIVVPRTSAGGAAHCGILCPSGTGQIVDVDMQWDE
jgi:hypothetical protein